MTQPYEDDNSSATASVTEDTAPADPRQPWRVVCHRCEYVCTEIEDQDIAIAVAEAHLETAHQQYDPEAVIVPGDRRTFQPVQEDPMTGDTGADDRTYQLDEIDEARMEQTTVEVDDDYSDIPPMMSEEETQRLYDVATEHTEELKKQASDHREGTGTATFDLG